MNSAIRNYALVTAAYWGQTLSDGALRMLVLLHFNRIGYTPLQIAFLFLFYEFFGIVTNLVGGWIAARLGLKVTLFSGLTCQVIALSTLALLNPAWSVAISVAYVMASQALSGIAKDLTKMSSKSAVKALVPANAKEGSLYKWVAILTGSKNALKGAGFFLGGAMLGWLGFAPALWTMAGALLLVLLICVVALPREIGHAKEKVGFRRNVLDDFRGQCSFRSALLSVWRARCLVRRRPAGLSLRPTGMELRAGRRFPRGMGDWLRLRASVRACCSRASRWQEGFADG